MSSLRDYTVFYRGNYFYSTTTALSAIKHLSLYGRLSLYDLETHTTIIRKACNIFVIPADVEYLLTHGRPWSSPKHTITQYVYHTRLFHHTSTATNRLQ